jgi:Fe-S-cluster-containing dehydrogenase component
MGKKKTKVKVELTRRDVLTVAGAAVGSAVAAQFLTTGPLSPFAGFKQQQLLGQEAGKHGGSAGKHHWGMVIDLEKCIGCEYCTRACTAVNDVWSEEPWNIVVREENRAGQTFFFSRPCLHCQDAPCVEVCPVKATFVREDGIVIMNYDRCIGCRYCQIACPYDARRFNWQARQDENPFSPTFGLPEVERRPRGVVEKCTFCVHRIDSGLASGRTPGVDRDATPACVNVCPVGARTFGDLKDPNSNISKLIASNPVLTLRQELGTNPSVFYIPPKEGL